MMMRSGRVVCVVDQLSLIMGCVSNSGHTSTFIPILFTKHDDTYTIHVFR